MGSLEILKKDQSIVEAEIVSAIRTQKGFAVGVKIKSCVQYLFQETYIQPGTKVYIKVPEFQLLQK